MHFLNRDLMFEILELLWGLVFGSWDFIGTWDLDFEILSSAFPLSTPLPAEYWSPKAASRGKDSLFQKLILQLRQNQEANPIPPINETTSPVAAKIALRPARLPTSPPQTLRAPHRSPAIHSATTLPVSLPFPLAP